MSKLLFFQHSHDFHLCTTVFQRLQDTTAQIRVRGAFILLVAFVALAGALGLETILGAFIAGVILRLIDSNCMMMHPQFR